MFYRMIENKRNRWLASSQCTVKELLTYIERTGQMRDAQIEAIKTYLFLKIGFGCKPLVDLFISGSFNTLDLDAVELSKDTREYLQSNPAAAALFEYSRLKNDAGEQVSEKLERAIKQNPDSVNYRQVFRDAFYGVSYTDYLFSLPMGAGKTYLMAAFIYLDLYFAMNEPENPAFAHNFIIFAPSGLKSSVVPSLKTIQKFDPTWVIPDPAATDIKRMISFEVLDQNKTEKKSNKAKNPNSQKILNHQPLSDTFGLVAVTNAEKVIYELLDEEDMQLSLFSKDEQARIRQAKELRVLIGDINRLSVFIDEVHHASAAGNSKLRKVVERWTLNQSFNSVVGFSGTPYLDKAEKIKATGDLSVATAEITNIVYYYPLINGVGNFLKRPIVKISDVADSSRIIEQGVRDFLTNYKDTVYDGDLTAKLGIYCSSIPRLEEIVYPIVARIVEEYGLPTNCILKFYRESSSKNETKKKYVAPADSQMEFDTLDLPISQKRIVLLVQIGKEGWDCRSLTGIILSQEGDCNRTMVLQTSCRCLRQVEKGRPETALIWLNDTNAKKLEEQLNQQQHISIQEFMSANHEMTTLKRYDRTAYLKLPKIDFYQLKVNYETQVLEVADPGKLISSAADGATKTVFVRTTDFSMATGIRETDEEEWGTEPATFAAWLGRIVRESLYTIDFSDLEPYRAQLYQIFETITYQRGEARFFSSTYDIDTVTANVRKAFSDKRDFTSTEELIPQESCLLNITNFKPEIQTGSPDDYYPDQATVERIVLDDAGKLKVDKNTKQMMELAEATGQTAVLEILRKQTSSHPQKDRSFHYLPYHTDSSFEQKFLEEVLSLTEIESLGLEVYYNGDRVMTEFKIKCYKHTGNKWTYIGMYTPDFLIVQRKDGKIYKAVIVETKGKIYANDPTFKDKREFMETKFSRLNNDSFGYERFDYLYLEDTLPEKERIKKAHKEIYNFFEGVL